MHPSWWTFKTTLPQSHLLYLDPESAGEQLMALGIASVDTSDAPLIRCFLQSSKDDLDRITGEIKLQGLEISEITEVPAEGWIEKCEEVWQKIDLGDLTIVPILDDQQKIVPSSNEIFIIPGLGFGTGHHATTRSLVSRLIELRNNGTTQELVLDVGTGSGVLALAAYKLFGCAVVATDIDDDALSNANKNVSLNECQSKIILLLESSKTLRNSFDMIIANIYAEVLATLEPEFCRLLKPGGRILLSGVAQDRVSIINEHFTKASGWLQTWCREDSGWCSFEFKRIRS